jgi:DNA-binding NtrC family response regulator
VRELRNVIERAVVLVEGNVIMPADLPRALTGVASGSAQAPTAGTAASAPIQNLAEGTVTDATGGRALTPEEAAERHRIIEVLEQCAGNQTRAARLLGMSLRTLVNRLAKYNVTRPRKPS